MPFSRVGKALSDTLAADMGDNAHIATKAAVVRKGAAAPDITAQTGGVFQKAVPLQKKL